MIIYHFENPALIDGISLYADEAERVQHIGHIVSIAQCKRQSVAAVTAWYEHILAELKPRAGIPDYLGALVTRKVIDLLNK